MSHMGQACFHLGAFALVPCICNISDAIPFAHLLLPLFSSRAVCNYHP